MVEITTSTTFDDGVPTFEGVLLADFLRAMGAADADEIVVRASDDYIARIPRSDWTTWPIVLATRQSGRPLGRRERGPVRIIYPRDQYPELADEEHTNRMAWLIEEISR